MYCTSCGHANPDDVAYCSQCGSQMAPGRSAAPATIGVPADEELAGLGRRAASYVVDGVLQVIPILGAIFAIVNLAMYRRGNSIGLKLLGARIVRENGNLSGFYHTWVRAAAALLSPNPPKG